MAAGRAYTKDESVRVAEDCPLGGEEIVRQGTSGTVTHDSPAAAATVRVKWSGVDGPFKVTPKRYVTP